ncbi:hypothetical protein R1flu_017490 [Riccia fluitans]|uniref:Uncharacterized protein n=1 Tax=Riccia fluitans TaxID=41844 RepID=A0ABD1ZDB4_9MARC
MMLRGGFRKVAQTLRSTLVGRLASLQQGEIAAHDFPGSSQPLLSAAEVAAFHSRDYGATIGPRASAGRSQVSPRSLSGAYCVDRHAKMQNSVQFYEYKFLLAESVQRNSYSLQRRNLASTTEKPLEQTDRTKPVASDASTAKATEDITKTIKEGNTQDHGKSFGSRVKHLLADLENVPVPALGLGLAGAIPFVALTPGIASILPLPESLYAVHMEAQAAYGAVILTFLGGLHWGFAMVDNGGTSKSVFSRFSVRTLRYVWSVTPSLIAWQALLLPLAPKYAVLITSFGLVLGVDALFTRMGLLPPWYMPLRILLTSIAMLTTSRSTTFLVSKPSQRPVPQIGRRPLSKGAFFLLS